MVRLCKFEILTFLDEWAAGIEMPETNSTDEVHIYSIDGRQLPEMQHGLNIVNGKKVLKR